MKVVENENELLRHNIDACAEDIECARDEVFDVNDEMNLTIKHFNRFELFVFLQPRFQSSAHMLGLGLRVLTNLQAQRHEITKKRISYN